MVKCPLCETQMDDRETNGTYIWVCPECPAVLIEYYSSDDVDAFIKAIV